MKNDNHHCPGYGYLGCEYTLAHWAYVYHTRGRSLVDEMEAVLVTPQPEYEGALARLRALNRSRNEPIDILAWTDSSARARYDDLP